MKSIMLKPISEPEFHFTPGELTAAMATLNNEELLVAMAVLASYSSNKQPSITDVMGLVRLENRPRVESVIQRLIDKQYLKGETVTMNDGDSIRPVLFIEPNFGRRAQQTPVRVKFQKEFEPLPKIEAGEHDVKREAQKEKSGFKKEKYINNTHSTSMSPASQDSSSCAADGSGEVVDAIGQKTTVKGLNHAWLNQLNSADKDVRRKAVNQIGKKYATIYKDVRDKAMPGAKPFYIHDKTIPKFADLAKLCISSGINFAEYIRHSYSVLMNWKNRNVDFPTPDMLLSDRFLGDFMNRAGGTQITITAKPNAFRTDLKNQSLPEALGEAGFQLELSEIKFAETIARQRKLNMDAGCPDHLEAAVQWIIVNGCPDL